MWLVSTFRRTQWFGFAGGKRRHRLSPRRQGNALLARDSGTLVTWTPPPPTDPPNRPPPPLQCPSPPPPGAFGPLLLGGGVAYKSEETSPPCPASVGLPVEGLRNRILNAAGGCLYAHSPAPPPPPSPPQRPRDRGGQAKAEGPRPHSATRGGRKRVGARLREKHHRRRRRTDAVWDVEGQKQRRDGAIWGGEGGAQAPLTSPCWGCSAPWCRYALLQTEVTLVPPALLPHYCPRRRRWALHRGERGRAHVRGTAPRS